MGKLTIETSLFKKIVKNPCVIKLNEKRRNRKGVHGCHKIMLIIRENLETVSKLGGHINSLYDIRIFNMI